MTTINIGEVQRLAKQLSPADQLRLVEELARDLRQHQGDYPTDLPAAAYAAATSAVLPNEDFSDWEQK